MCPPARVAAFFAPTSARRAVPSSDVDARLRCQHCGSTRAARLPPASVLQYPFTIHTTRFIPQHIHASRSFAGQQSRALQPESPRWLASKGRIDEALVNLAYLRKLPTDHDSVRSELAEIEASIEEEREARAGLGWKEAFLGKGNWPRFLIAFVIFVLQQFSGQNTVNYYAPQIFEAIGYTGTTPSLLASGVYGIVKVVATAIFIFFGVESLGRVWSLRISGFGMGALFFMIGAILKTHPPAVSTDGSIPPASRAMAGLLYIYVCFYSMGWGPVPWVYVSDIFPTRTRAYGLGWASATQWLFNFVVSQISLTIKRELGWKLFLLFGTINIGGMVTFTFFIPETKGRSLEEMDVVFGSVSAEKREQDIARAERALGGGARAEEDNEKSSEKQDERV